MSGNTLTFTGLIFTVGNVGTIVITGRAGAITSGQTLLNTATISGNIFDNSLSNNTDTVVSTGLARISDLYASITTPSVRTYSGQIIRYNIAITNSGIHTVTGYTISITLPTSIELQTLSLPYTSS